MWEILRSKYTTDGFFDWNQLGEDVTPLFSNVGTIDFMSLFPPSLTPRSGALFEPIPKEKPIPKEAAGYRGGNAAGGGANSGPKGRDE